MAELVTQEMIAEGMVRAEKGACSPGDDRCYLLPDPLDKVRASCTPMGRCRIEGTRRGIVTNAGCDSWDVWLNGHTGPGRLRRQTR